MKRRMAMRSGRSVALISLVGGTAMAATPQGSPELLGPPNMPVIELSPDFANPTGKRAAEPKPSVPTGNPLWSIPLSALSATRERPVFAPSRRPPPPAVVNVPFVAPARVAAPPPPPPPRPNLVLIGTITGDDDVMPIAMFLDQGTNTVIRLRAGDVHLGWTLETVHGRAAIMQNGSQRETYDLPKEQPRNASPNL